MTRALYPALRDPRLAPRAAVAAALACARLRVQTPLVSYTSAPLPKE